jgi:two-component system LytT family response regulator
VAERRVGFWPLQLAGWLALVGGTTLPWLGSYALRPMLANKALLAGTGIATTLALRALYRRKLGRAPAAWRAAGAVAAASLAGGTAWTVALNLAVWRLLTPDAPFAGARALLHGTLYHTLVLTAWSALYVALARRDAVPAHAPVPAPTGAPAPPPAAPEPDDRVVLRDAGRVLVLEAGEVEWIEAEADYVRLHVGARSHLVRETMAALEARLPAAHFARVHRSAIVNVRRVRELRPRPNGDYDVLLRGGALVRASRTYRDRLRAAFGDVV